MKKLHPKDLFTFLFLFPIVALTAILFFYLLFITYYKGKFYPGIQIATIAVGNQSPSEVKRVLNQSFQNKLQSTLKFRYEQQILELNLKDASPSLAANDSVEKAYLLGRSGDYLLDVRQQIKALIMGYKINPEISYLKPSTLIYKMNDLNQIVKKEPRNAALALGSEVIITPSQPGREIDSKKLFQQIDNYLIGLGPAPTAIPFKDSPTEFTTENAQAAKNALDNLKNNSIKIHYQDKIKNIDQVALFNLLNLKKGTTVFLPGVNDQHLSAQNLQTSQALIDNDKLAVYLQDWARNINQEARDARFVFDPQTKRAREFQSAQEGRAIDLEKLSQMITQALMSNVSSDIDLPVKVAQPKILTADVNSFGIKDLLGKGTSNFAGSIDNRIYNVRLAASRTNGVLIGPQETFSFNNAIGDVSGSTGYKQAYVIKSGRTVLDDGGGVCQVSTTLFRAVLNAGLPIVERTAHAYRVGYYEQGSPPGLDATVFSPSVDFKFKNDTPGYILVQSFVVGTILTFELYGTPDGRVTTVSTPKILSQTPPLPNLRQDDPTLPRGTVKQVDWPAWGANVVFNRTVTQDGEILIQETFKSNYRPWQAVYLVGTRD